LKLNNLTIKEAAMFYTYDLFDDMFRLRDVLDDFYSDTPAKYNRRIDFPYVNIYQNDDVVTAKAIVPGIEAGDIDIELQDKGLVLQGTRKSDYEEWPYIRKERSFGEFKKIVRLPYQVDRDKIKASLKEGVLTIILPKAEEAKPKKITIK
jgi:HSP20 family protein